MPGVQHASASGNNPVNATASRSPMGVIFFEGRKLCYEPFNGNYRVVVFGSGEPVGVTDELRAEIEKDVRKQQEKRA